VPFAKDAKHLAVLAGSSVALVETAPAAERWRQPRERASNTVTFDQVKPLAVAPATSIKPR
jgi:hypothetical protein